MNRPLCKRCHSVVPEKSFCMVDFPHANVPGNRLKHLFWYCPTCKERVGSPIPREFLITHGVEADTIIYLAVEVGSKSSSLKKQSKRPSVPAAAPKKAHSDAPDFARMAYPDYLQTEHWAHIRNAEFRRSRFSCMICCDKKDLQVHHRTYERLGCERPEDVITLCVECHAIYHDRMKNREHGIEEEG